MTIYVDVDTAKSTHYAAMTNQHGEVLIEPFAFNNDKSGFDSFLNTVKSSMPENEELIVGFESTAHYASNFTHFLDSNSISYKVINPLVTSSFRKSKIRKTKTDSVDSLLICNVLFLDINGKQSMIRNEELKGNKFFEIINDVIDFEKKVIGNEFTLIVDEEGNFKYSLDKSILISLGMCLTVGIIWFLMDREPISFVEGFFFPFVCILISSVFGLPVFFLEKKNKDAANVIKKIGKGLCVILFIIMILLVFFIK